MRPIRDFQISDLPCQQALAGLLQLKKSRNLVQTYLLARIANWSTREGWRPPLLFLIPRLLILTYSYMLGSGYLVQDDWSRIHYSGLRDYNLIYKAGVRALPTETEVEGGTSQSKSGISVELSKSGG